MKSNLFFSFVDVELLVSNLKISCQFEDPEFTLTYSSSKSLIGLAFNTLVLASFELVFHVWYEVSILLY